MDITTESSPDVRSVSELPELHWFSILSISIFALALNFQWAALGTIILPSQVFKMVGDLNKGTALAYVLIPGAFVSLFANPLFGWLSDRTHGRLARWGKRRPYIMVGTLASVIGLAWMATAPSVISLALAYAFTQFVSNAAQAPFHALLPDIVPPKQRGLASGVLGLLVIAGNIGGVLAAGRLLDSSASFSLYRQELWIVYGILIGVLLVFMVVTLFSLREPAVDATPAVQRWKLSRSVVQTIVSTIAACVLLWGLITLWNAWHLTNITISSDVEQVLIEILATLGILRLFDFRPRRDPDFAWVLVTRLVMMLGIYTIQNFLQYYMRDVVRVAHPEQETTNFLIVVSLTSLVSAFAAGWLSDRFGRKRLVYICGSFMAVVGVVFVLTHSLPIVIAAGAIFGLGYGAYQSVDWALVADVLPSSKNYARDMGVWNVALSLSQVMAPILGGPLLDAFAHAGHPVLGYQVLFSMAILYCVIGTVTVRFIRGIRA
ncbi:MFS transporter [Ktedonobacteria bacterium brp13]|nr:MFS transporter [Ktedonobacteria bacterium brp13]